MLLPDSGLLRERGLCWRNLLPSIFVEKPGKRSIWIWMILAISLSLNLYAIDWGLPNGGYDWANDSLAPLKPLSYLKRLVYQEPWSYKYPPFHLLLLGVFYTPYVLYLHLTGGMTSPIDAYPYGLNDPEFSLMIFTLIARATSALMGTGTVIVSYYTVKILYGARAAFISALLIASSYALIYYSHNANVEAPQLFWISFALYSFVSLLRTYETKYYVLLGVFAAFAIGTKDSAYALFLGLALSLIYLHVRHQQETGSLFSSLLHRKLWYGLLAFVTALIIVFNVALDWQGFINHLHFHLGRSVKGSPVIKQSASVLQGDLTLIGRYLAYLVQTNGVPTFVLMAAGFFYCLFRFPGKSWILIPPVVTYYFFFLRIFGADHLRYVLPVYLLLTWQAGKFAADLLEYRRIPKVISGVAIALILAHSLVYGSSLNLLLTYDSRYAAEKWITENVAPEAVIIAHGPNYSLPRFPVGRQVRYVHSKRGKINDELGSESAQYLVIDISLPLRVARRSEIYKSLEEMGFRPIASFKSPAPIWGAELFNAVNPQIVIFEQNHRSLDNKTG